MICRLQPPGHGPVRDREKGTYYPRMIPTMAVFASLPYFCETCSSCRWIFCFLKQTHPPSMPITIPSWGWQIDVKVCLRHFGETVGIGNDQGLHLDALEYFAEDSRGGHAVREVPPVFRQKLQEFVTSLLKDSA